MKQHLHEALWAGLGFLLALSAPALAADKPGEVLQLFNGKDLTNFYTYLGPPAQGEKPLGKNHDPDKVFTVKDGQLRISGQAFGGLVTQKEYGNYHLIVEYAWGQDTWPPRKDRARNSGILLHCTGAEGEVEDYWMKSIECQVLEGATGDLLLVGGKTKPSLTVTAVPQVVGEGNNLHKEYFYKPGAPPVPFITGRINWSGKDLHWKDVKGFRGQEDAEVPVGEWNRLECICDGPQITILLNGKTVNAGTQCSLTRGKIMIESEGAEIFLRRIELQLLKK
ncbi:MAG: DUF1080 domain-containing protein [Planctomycetes bacterium]|nr:DUF1080 domain-containing protein [Planctomycetota bacterium]